MISSQTPLTSPGAAHAKFKSFKSPHQLPLYSYYTYREHFASRAIKRSSWGHKDAHAWPLRLLVLNRDKGALINKSRWEVSKRRVSSLDIMEAKSQQMQPCDVVLSLNKDSLFFFLGGEITKCTKLPGQNEDHKVTQWACSFAYKINAYSLKNVT